MCIRDRCRSDYYPPLDWLRILLRVWIFVFTITFLFFLCVFILNSPWEWLPRLLLTASIPIRDCSKVRFLVYRKHFSIIFYCWSGVSVDCFSVHMQINNNRLLICSFSVFVFLLFNEVCVVATKSFGYICFSSWARVYEIYFYIFFLHLFLILLFRLVR